VYDQLARTVLHDNEVKSTDKNDHSYQSTQQYIHNTWRK